MLGLYLYVSNLDEDSTPIRQTENGLPHVTIVTTHDESKMEDLKNYAILMFEMDIVGSLITLDSLTSTVFVKNDIRRYDSFLNLSKEDSNIIEDLRKVFDPEVYDNTQKPCVTFMTCYKQEERDAATVKLPMKARIVGAGIYP